MIVRKLSEIGKIYMPRFNPIRFKEQTSSFFNHKCIPTVEDVTERPTYILVRNVAEGRNYSIPRGSLNSKKLNDN
jgi:hypothetical protein